MAPALDIRRSGADEAGLEARVPKPGFHTDNAPPAARKPALLVPVFQGRRKIANIAGIILWLASLAFFWVWWLDPAHIYTPGRYIVISLVLAWVTIIPAYLTFLFARASRPAPPPPDLDVGRAAMVVTKAPSEPFFVVRRTLLGALGQKGVKHDTWLADEEPDAETLAWCRAHDVKVSTRKGIEAYHRPDWPRRTRCKEGNLAYFYDTYGYAGYDFVAQFDADHVPMPTYLLNALAPFRDPAVGYVSAPSICDANAKTSWSARSRLFNEAFMHGALQTGYNSGFAPLCIGSHYTVRTAALKAVGGLGPELAEDHSTTLILNAGGWRGVHAVNAIARGDGPETFGDLITQEFQWSRSLIAILLRYSPTYLPRLRRRVRFQFLFSQLWYPLFSGVMALMYAMPVYALATGVPFARVTYIDFFVHMLPVTAMVIALAFWWRATGLFRPAKAKIFGWESMAFVFLRWPWSLFGSAIAVADHLRGRVADFRVTPKGAKAAGEMPLRVVAPYILLALVSAGVALAVEDPGTAAGFYIYNLFNAVLYGGLTLLILVRHAIENELPFFSLRTGRIITALALAAIFATAGTATYMNGPKGLAAMNAGITAFTLTHTTYEPAGAGQGAPGKAIVRLRFRWNW